MNGAVALRQPGSAIKPITYAAAMDPKAATGAGRSPLTAASVIADVRQAFVTAEGEPYVPQNYDMAWHGPVSARTAFQRVGATATAQCVCPANATQQIVPGVPRQQITAAPARDVVVQRVANADKISPAVIGKIFNMGILPDTPGHQ